MAAIGALMGMFSKPTNPLDNTQFQGQLASLQAPGSTTTTNADTNQASNFYRTVLGGGQDATRTLLGPDVETILGQYDNAAKAATNLGPRGGGRDAALADVGFQKAGAYGKLLAGAKTNAAQGLAGIGENQLQASTAMRGQNVNILGQLLGGSVDYQKLLQSNKEATMNSWNEMGKSIGAALAS